MIGLHAQPRSTFIQADPGFTFSGGPTEMRIIIIAGPNGAGKTTFAREFLPLES
jgi:RecA/RadA recombinase